MLVQAPARQLEIAPYLGEPSGLLRFLSFYFTVTGSFALVLAILALSFKLAGSTSIAWSTGVIALYGVNAAGLTWTGTRLRSRNRNAWQCGWFACMSTLVSTAFAGEGVLTQVIFAVVSLVLLYFVRGEFE